jgi:hypothetical protein
MNPKLTTQLRQLLREGYIADTYLELPDLLIGLAHPVETGGWVVSARLLAVREKLSSDSEWVAALLALLPEVRAPWLAILAARCLQAGQMEDASVLLQLISQLADAAAWVEESLPTASLSATALAGFERELLGVSAEQAQATPILARILAVTWRLSCLQSETLPMLPTVDLSGVDVAQNWCAGRLLALPNARTSAGYVLHNRRTSTTEEGAMAWVLANPWALLLSMVVYAQDAWSAEARGGLLLELPTGQSPYQPAEVEVLVQNADEHEQRCGSLAELLLRVLAHLGMQCFPRQPSPEVLNALLAPLIGELLQRQVWRYRDGVSGSQGFFQIHPDFADQCYKIVGAKIFNRNGRPIWQAVRLQTEQWRNEQRIQAKAITA